MQKGQQKHYALLFPTFVRHTFMAFKTINNSVQVQKMLWKRTMASRIYLELGTSPDPMRRPSVQYKVQVSTSNDITRPTNVPSHPTYHLLQIN
jgi:hypothetical protein